MTEAEMTDTAGIASPTARNDNQTEVIASKLSDRGNLRSFEIASSLSLLAMTE